MRKIAHHRWYLAALVTPLLIWFVLKGLPTLDVEIGAPTFHLVLMTVIAASALIVATAAARAAVQLRQTNLVLLAAGCVLVGLMLLGHGLTTPFLILARDGSVIFANLAAVDQLGGPGAGAEAPGAYDAILQKKKVQAAIDAVFQDGEDRVAARIKHQGVVPRAYRVVATRLEPEKGAEDIRAVLSFEDISHIREAEQMRATNAPEADQFIRREYRKGWNLV